MHNLHVYNTVHCNTGQEGHATKRAEDLFREILPSYENCFIRLNSPNTSKLSIASSNSQGNAEQYLESLKN